MARAPRVIDAEIEAPPEADRLGGWPHPRATRALFGHEAGEAVLAGAMASGRLHHAWLITGEEGIGKATLAYRTARFLLAQDGALPREVRSLALPEDDRTARQVAHLSHPGLIVLRRAWDTAGKKFRQSIAIDDIRQLRHFLQRTAATPWRAVVIDAADDLNTNSANALLKSLEEPPPRTVFLVIANSPGRLLPTIRSRCRTLRLQPLAPDALKPAVAAACRQAGRDVPDDAQLAKLFALAKGSPRRVLQLLDGGGLALFELLLTILASLPRMDRAALHRLIALTSGRNSQAHGMAFDLLEETLSEAMHHCITRQQPDSSFPQMARFASGMAAGSLADWAGVWETVREMRGEAERLNLDKAALTLTVFEQIERTARQAASRAI